MLSVNNVTKKYGKVIANENISLQIADGQIAVLLGPNGAGKSTIIKSIIGSQIPGKCYGRWTSQQVNRGKTYYGLYS